MKWWKRSRLKEVLKSNCKNNAIYYLWGIPYRLLIKKGNKIIIKNDNIEFFTSSINSQDKNRDILMEWYYRLLENEIYKIKSSIEKIVGVNAEAYYVKEANGKSSSIPGNIYGRCDIKTKNIEINKNVVFLKEKYWNML